MNKLNEITMHVRLGFTTKERAAEERALLVAKQKVRYARKFLLALQRNPTFAKQHELKGTAWMRRHYTYADLDYIIQMQPPEPSMNPTITRLQERIEWHEKHRTTNLKETL